MTAKKKAKTKETKTEIENLPVASKHVSPALIRDAKASQDYDDIEMPDVIKPEMIEDEAPSGFNPLIDFEGEPGRWIVAKYIGARPDIGPNDSYMYDFESVHPDTRETFIASLWGSKILDRKIEILSTKGSLKPGKFVFVQYLGTVATSRGLNPAKNFKIVVIKDGALDKYYDALKKSA